MTVTGLSLGGAAAGNYVLSSTTATATADIEPRALAVTATGQNKEYDGTTAATVTLADDRISGDVFTASYTSATFADANAGTGKAITVSGISISGADAGNYTPEHQHDHDGRHHRARPDRDGGRQDQDVRRGRSGFHLPAHERSAGQRRRLQRRPVPRPRVRASLAARMPSPRAH